MLLGAQALYHYARAIFANAPRTISTWQLEPKKGGKLAHGRIQPFALRRAGKLLRLMEPQGLSARAAQAGVKRPFSFTGSFTVGATALRFTDIFLTSPSVGVDLFTRITECARKIISPSQAHPNFKDSPGILGMRGKRRRLSPRQELRIARPLAPQLPSRFDSRATHARTLLPELLASVPFEFV
jgi:hypothetical protein